MAETLEKPGTCQTTEQMVLRKLTATSCNWKSEAQSCF